MMMFEYYVDAVDEQGNVTKSCFDHELGFYDEAEEEGFDFNGRDISCILIGAYNYGGIEGFKLHDGAAPRSHYDYGWRDAQHNAEIEKLQQAGDRLAGWGENPPSYYRNGNHGAHHWMTIDELLAQDWQRLVRDVREVSDWNKRVFHGHLSQATDEEKKRHEELLNEAPLKTIEDFIGEDVLGKLRALKDKGFTRFTCWVN